MYTNVDMCTQNGLSTQMESMNIIKRRMKDIKKQISGDEKHYVWNENFSILD